jgi:membrane protease subunit HflK
LYLQTIEEVYGSVSKVFLDAASSGNLLYLPVDKLMEQRRQGGAGMINLGPATDNNGPGSPRDEERSGRTRR